MTHTQASDPQRAWPSATLMTFPQLFADSRSFYIPAYQRPYDWGKSQRDDLLQDIERLERLALSSPEASHFCGTIICTPQKYAQGSFAIVDGQQRITTLAILHAQLCRAVGKQTFISKLGSVRFSPQPQDEEVFANILNGGKPGETTTLAQSNYVAAASQLGMWVEARKSNAERLLELIEHRLSFIFFVLVDENEVAKVFETINNRGKPLTQMDLVKNHLIYLSAINNWTTPSINEVWRQIQQIVSESRLSDADVDTVLRATVTAQFWPGKRSAGDTDFKIAARKLPEDSEEYEDFKEFVLFLKSNFQTYSKLRNARSTDPKDPVTRALTHLNHHDSITGMLPLIFARQFRREDNHSDAPVLTAIEKANFRLYGLRKMAARSDSFNVKLHKLANEYFVGEITDQSVISELASLVTRGPKDGLSTIVQSLTIDDDDDFDFYTWPWRRYFLARFEEFLLDRQSFDFSKLTSQYAKSGRLNDYLSVEHIWPKNAKDKTVEEYRERQQIRRLGNLMLLPHGLNITLSNNTPEVKIEKAEAAKITLLRQNVTLADVVAKAANFVSVLQNRDDVRFGARRNRFNSKTIEKNGPLALVKTICDLREEEMIEFALSEWRLPGETGVDREFLGVFSFAHSDETFQSEKEGASNKSKENYVIVSKRAASDAALSRLKARNDVMKFEGKQVGWK